MGLAMRFSQICDAIDKFAETIHADITLTRKPDKTIELFIRDCDDPSMKKTEKFKTPLQVYEWLKEQL